MSRVFDQTNVAEELKAFPFLPDEAGIRLRGVCLLVGCSPATAWRYAKSGKLKTQKISAGVTVFKVGSIRELLQGGAQ